MNLSGSAEWLKGKQLNVSLFKRSISRPFQSSRLWVFAAVQPQIALLVSSHFEALWVSRPFLPKAAAIIGGGRVNKPGREYGRKHFPATAVALRPSGSQTRREKKGFATCGWVAGLCGGATWIQYQLSSLCDTEPAEICWCLCVCPDGGSAGVYQCGGEMAFFFFSFSETHHWLS